MTGLLTPREAAAWLKVSVRLLAALPIRRVRIGRLVRYDPQDLQLFADLNGDRDRLGSQDLHGSARRAGNGQD